MAEMVGDVVEQRPVPSAEASLPRPATAADLFPDGGELGALIRARDWAATPLGPVGRWPQSLRTAVSMVLYSDFPMIVLWGPRLIQLYNDAYRLLMGTKHPGGLGQGNRECWPEAWHINEAIYPRVFAGETLSFREAPYPLAPYGVVEDFYLTLSYSPVRDESGAVGGVFVTVFDVTRGVRTRAERDRALAEAKAERERLYEVFQQAPAAIAVVEGPDSRITVANARYAELVGNRDLIGRTAREAFPEAEMQGFLALLDTVRASGEPYAATEALVRLDRRGTGAPEDSYVDFVYQPLRAADGHVFGIMSHAVEVTGQVLARKELERRTGELTRLTHALAQSNRELDQFAYVASHDLKAPLRGIANLAQWIQEDLGDRLTGESEQHMQLLQGRVRRMEALIDGVLAYARAGRARGDVERVDTGALVREVVELLAPEPGVAVEVEAGMPAVEAERVPLQQVFLNLIGNAVKYAHAARPDVRVRVGWRGAPDADEFTVADNGPGIAPEFQSRIWGIFQRLEARDKVEGTGIGLSVVKKIVESRGGRVWVESEPGRGATFHFTWPKTRRHG